MPPILVSMVQLMRKSFLTLEILSRMYEINFIAQVCVLFFQNTMTGCFGVMLKVTLSKA